ncbi:MAG: TetR/AcrR family transcriptional regulator [Gemmatimonadota bacterium]
MAKNTLDRRVQRTRRALQDALVAMMIEKGYEQTSVREIIERAKVGRATFYEHFADKETLLFSGLEDLRTGIRNQQRAHPGTLSFSLALLEHARGHLPLWNAIVADDGDAFVLGRIQLMVADLAAIDLKALSFAGTEGHGELAAQCVAGAFVGLLRWWLSHGAATPPASVDAQFRDFVMRGLTRR